jgi:hypothetical protein
MPASVSTHVSVMYFSVSLKGRADAMLRPSYLTTSTGTDRDETGIVLLKPSLPLDVHMQLSSITVERSKNIHHAQVRRNVTSGMLYENFSDT